MPIPLWAVELQGHQFDLADAKTLFSSGHTTVTDQTVTGGQTIVALLSDDLDTLTVSTEVQDAARLIVNWINGILYVRDKSRQPLTVGHIYQKHGNGWMAHAIINVQGVSIRTRVGTVTFSINGTSSSPPPPEEQAFLIKASSDDTVADVLLYLSNQPDWFDLYKAFERMRDDINRAVGQHNQQTMGWPDKANIDLFTESANVHRHSPAKWTRYNPSTAMSLDSARAFVQSLAQIWLRWRP